jgi:hypothetical protein
MRYDAPRAGPFEMDVARDPDNREVVEHDFQDR